METIEEKHAKALQVLQTVTNILKDWEKATGSHKYDKLIEYAETNLNKCK